MRAGDSEFNLKAKPRRRSAAKHNPNSLSAPLTSFVGRVREIAEVQRLVLTNRLVTLTGTGGCGKTRLATIVAGRLLPRFEDGVWFIELAGLDASVSLPQVVGATLHLSQSPERPPPESLIHFLQDKRVLLVLDNCEHILPGCAELVRMLLEACPRVHILATSRESLSLTQETVWLVPSLALPDTQRASDWGELASAEAVQLFVARAKAVLPDFEVNETNASTVGLICKRLDGIPLAIELAAARLKMLDVTQIASRLEDTLRLLTRTHLDTAPRHQTMRAALDWSYKLLSPQEQVLFQRLAVFANGFTLEAVEAVCADESGAQQNGAEFVVASDMLDLLTELVRKSLVVIAERSAGEPVRYRLLEPIRQYALQMLDAYAQVSRDKHLAYLVRFAELSEQALKSEHQRLWLARLDKEHDNLRAALAWSAQNGSRSVAGLRLAKALHLYWQQRGHWSEGRDWLSQTISRYRANSDAHAPGDDIYLARALVAQAWLAVYLRDYAGIRPSLEQALELARQLGEQVTQALALGLLSLLSTYVGDNDTAHQLAEASVECARRAQDDWVLAWTLHVLGRNRYYRGDVEDGRAALEESETHYRRTRDKRWLAIHINTLAIIAQNSDEFETARRLYEEALEIGKELDDNDLYMKEISNLAGLALIEGDLSRAKQLSEETLARARELQTKGVMMDCFVRLIHIHLAEGDIDTARAYLRSSLPLVQETGHQMAMALVLAGMARLAAADGLVSQAGRAIGVVDGFLNSRLVRLDADDAFLLRHAIAAVRAVPATKEFETAFAGGHTLSLEQALKQIGTLDAVATQAPRTLAAPPQLKLRALGRTRVFLGERAITTWSYARVKELLFYLALHPSRTKAQIGLALWPDASLAQLRNSLGTGLYHLRRTLGNSDWILFEDEEYRFNRTLAYQFDVEKFEANLAQASRLQEQMPTRAIELLEEALRLYQGDLAEDFLEGEWFLLRREELRRKYLDGLDTLGQLYLQQGDYARAAQVYRQAIAKDSVMESAHRALMRSYARLGERGQALRQYQVLEQIMRDELGSPPAVESVALYEKLKHGEPI